MSIEARVRNRLSPNPLYLPLAIVEARDWGKQVEVDQRLQQQLGGYA